MAATPELSSQPITIATVEEDGYTNIWVARQQALAIRTSHT